MQNIIYLFGRNIMNRDTTILFTLFLCTAITACGTGIARDALLRQMQTGNAPLIVDVRSQEEYDRDHLPGAVRIPFYSIGSGLQQAGFLKKNPVVLYCEHGPRAGIAGFTLFLSGYEQVYSLEGHMHTWRSHEYPIEIKNH
jgi:rhodanese-related sulfurtransferase